jgi:hypothetical protein
MNTPHSLKHVVAGTLLSGGLAVAGLTLAPARAHAEVWCPPNAMVGAVCYGPNQWCPGDSLFHLTQNHVADPINWDMSVCHTYYYVPFGKGNAGHTIWDGPNPPGPQVPIHAPPGLPPPPGKCWNMWIPGPCPGG